MSRIARIGSMLRNLVGGGPRAAGPPRSANGASSFHLIWEMPLERYRQVGAGTGLVEVSAVLEVLEPPRGEALHFWALQVDFSSGGGVWGSGHTGLQWNSRYRGHTAVNWGGYASAHRGGYVLPGTLSALGGFADDPNTLFYPWEQGYPYRFRVFRSPETAGAWRAEVTDLRSGVYSTIRDLLPITSVEGLQSYLVRPIVWSEVFADCDAPSVAVRWSDLVALDESGSEVRPAGVRVNYQSPEEGGCSNTTVGMDEAGGLLQVTNMPRVVRQGTVLVFPRTAAS